MSIDQLFNQILNHFLSQKEVKKQGNSLKFNRKMFLMLNQERFIVKLPAERVAALIESGEGLPYDAGTGKQLKEWLIISGNDLKFWIKFGEEAKAYAQTLSQSD
jgi:hypothetical protein